MEKYGLKVFSMYIVQVKKKYEILKEKIIVFLSG